MADTLEKRVQGLEYIIAHLPEDLSARFAGVDLEFATVRETQALHTQQFTTIERKVEGVEQKVDSLQCQISVLSGQMVEVLQRLPRT